MTASELKLDLLQKIEALNKHQLKDVYGMLQNYFRSNESIEEWDLITEEQKEKIELGIRQAEARNTRPAATVIGDLRKKYNING